MLNVHKATESERNALVHGHFGTVSTLPDAFIWQETNDYVLLRTYLISHGAKWDKARHEQLLPTIWVYRKPDLEKLYEEIKELAQLWHELTIYLKIAITDPEERDAAYNRLCGRSRIAQELENIRRKNNPSAQSPSPQPVSPAKS